MFNLNTPSTKANKLSVPLIDTSEYTESQLNALPSELARRSRVGRLAAAMKSLHEETMRNFDAGVMDEQQQTGGIDARDKEDQFMFSSSSSPSGSAPHGGNNNVTGEFEFASPGLKFHAVGWQPHTNHHHSSQQRRKKQQPHQSSSVSRRTPTSRVISNEPNSSNQHQQEFYREDDLVSNNNNNEGTTRTPSRNNRKTNHVSPSTTTTSKAGSWASASRQRQQLQNIVKKQDDNAEVQGKLQTSSIGRKSRELMMLENINEQQASHSEKTTNNHDQQSRIITDIVDDFPGETEGEKFRNASVALRNINLKLKVMFEKRYRARLDDSMDPRDDLEEKRRRREAQNIVKREEEQEKRKQKRRDQLADQGLKKEEIEQLEKQGNLFEGMPAYTPNNNKNSNKKKDEENNNDDDDDFGLDEGRGGNNNPKLSLLLDQRERELADATRQWKQSALDAELLSGELLRAQATIERYKLFMDETTTKNEELRSEVESLKRELFLSKGRNQRLVEDNQLREDSMSGHGSFTRRRSLTNKRSELGSFTSSSAAASPYHHQNRKDNFQNKPHNEHEDLEYYSY